MTRPLAQSQDAESGRLSRRDRRGFKRVELKLTGRFLVGDTDDFELRTANMSCDGAFIVSKELPGIDEQIVCYFDDVGRVVANVVRHSPGGFAVRFHTSPHKRDKLADRLTWLINRDRLGLDEERGSERYRASGEAVVNLSDGGQLKCSVTDISLTGAAFEANGKPPFVGEKVSVGNLVGEVVRVTGNKFAVRYIHGQKPASRSDV
ncbi:PilZ domain-containing protein [Hyphomonas sp. WL0036]|uniref:PilZ domain-containing protein n=1 Tax=Hyphomonas sediminis TaxID=2866160 RepID=UPI001C8161F7|nr:PilZ domain-containing protein [Hyphomonas sediminis]MBY9068504.1 PilZ domain-containing protein [Hyphomonas sediminis]